MNAADLIKACQAFEDEHGIDEFLILMNDVMLARAQANGLNIEYDMDDEDDGEDTADDFHTLN